MNNFFGAHGTGTRLACAFAALIATPLSATHADTLSRDATFASNGLFKTEIGPHTDSFKGAYGMALQADGKGEVGLTLLCAPDFLTEVASAALGPRVVTVDPAHPERLRALQITQQGLTVSSLDATSGTPLYMAPELLRGEGPTTRSDVFALGVMLYQMLCGQPPFVASGLGELLAKHLYAEAEPLAARVTAPRVGCSSPASSRSAVDLPHPEGPTSATISPARRSRSTGPRARPRLG